MLTFNDYEYKRPDITAEREKFDKELDAFKSASTVEEAVQALDSINERRSNLSTMHQLVLIRASIDTNDAYYQAERDHFDEIGPVIQEMDFLLYQQLIDSPHRPELEAKYGQQIFKIADFEVRSFSPEIMDLLKEENKLSSAYNKLVASAEIEFQGNTYTLAQLAPFAQNENREIRKQAVEANAGFFSANEKKFDDIYDRLVKVRQAIAEKLGYENFVEVGYLRMLRIDYNAEMVDVFRRQVRESIVPLATKLYERQAARIGLDMLKFYDEKFEFKSGNATPKGTPEWIIANGKTMYEELSEETKEFFQFMLDRNLLDLEAKKGKEAGGYCTFIQDHKAPFIFSNFNGTSDDIDVLTHEAGHAFQVYESRNIDIPEYTFPTMESAEIHSMSMEFFTWPWMELFFEGDTDKYKFTHLAGALQFLPYGVAVDEFQHRIYENPDWSSAERKAAWREIEKVYLPHRDYDGIDYLEAGGFWHRQGHIYDMPFYYIDYTLAQICAFQFWKKSRENHAAAWDDYVNLCKLGGSKPFLELVAAAKLQSPFEEGTVEEVVAVIENWLDSVEDQKL